MSCSPYYIVNTVTADHDFDFNMYFLSGSFYFPRSFLNLLIVYTGAELPRGHQYSLWRRIMARSSPPASVSESADGQEVGKLSSTRANAKKASEEPELNGTEDEEDGEEDGEPEYEIEQILDAKKGAFGDVCAYAFSGLWSHCVSREWAIG